MQAGEGQEARMQSNSIRMGVDIGGTFTDVVLEKAGALYSVKVLTTYAAPEDAIIDGLHQVCGQAGVCLLYTSPSPRDA